MRVLKELQKEEEAKPVSRVTQPTPKAASSSRRPAARGPRPPDNGPSGGLPPLPTSACIPQRQSVRAPQSFPRKRESTAGYDTAENPGSELHTRDPISPAAISRDIHNRLAAATTATTATAAITAAERSPPSPTAASNGNQNQKDDKKYRSQKNNSAATYHLH